MKRLLITGASGNLGRPLSHLASRNSDCELYAAYFHNSDVGGGREIQLDLRDSGAVSDMMQKIRPEVVIHCAASDQSSDMVATNRSAAINLAEACRSIGARLLALSTDMVFDGRMPPYSEESPPAPLSDYGRVKAENETALLELRERCLVVRTSLIYDFSPANRQIAWMIEHIEAKRPVRLFVDEIRHPIWAWNLAEALLELAASDVYGLIQVAGPQPLSRYEYGCVLLAALGHSPDGLVEGVYAAEIAPDRPRDLTLDLSRARAVLKTPLLTIQEAVLAAQHADRYGHAISTTTRR